MRAFLGSSRRLGAIVALVGVAPFVGCKEEERPVDVPFDGVDPASVKRNPALSAEPTVASTSIPTAEASADATLRTAGPHHASIAPCCQALRSGSKTAKDEAARANYASATSACETQRLQLDQGKVTRTQALLAVRLSLLDEAPAPCR